MSYFSILGLSIETRVQIEIYGSYVIILQVMGNIRSALL